MAKNFCLFIRDLALVGNHRHCMSLFLSSTITLITTFTLNLNCFCWSFASYFWWEAETLKFLFQLNKRIHELFFFLKFALFFLLCFNLLKCLIWNALKGSFKNFSKTLAWTSHTSKFRKQQGSNCWKVNDKIYRRKILLKRSEVKLARLVNFVERFLK